MQLYKKITIKKLLISVAFACFLTMQIQANESLREIDAIRAELQCIKDKNSPYYIKAKQKLQKTISKYDIEYSYPSRINDVKRMIQEGKHNAAIYELTELINNNYEVSLCNELLADISIKCANPPRRIIELYKLAIKHDPNNTSAMFKLAKTYAKEKKTQIAIDYLKQTVEKTEDYNLLNEIIEAIAKITPQNKYEANNLYETLGNAYVKLGKKDLSYQAFNEAIKHNAKDIYLKYYLSELLFKNNQNNLAIEILNSIILDMPNDMQIKATKAKAYAKMGNIQEAHNTYNQILLKNPNSIQARYGIYKLYESKLNPSEILKKINSNKPDYKPTIQDYSNFAKLLEGMGEIEAAQNFEIYQLNLIEPDCATLKPEVKKQEENQEVKKQEEKTIKQTPQKQQYKQYSKKRNYKKRYRKTRPNINTPKTQIKEQAKPIKKELTPKQLQEIEKRNIQLEHKKAIEKNPKKYQQLKLTAEKYLAQEPKTAQGYIAAANTYKQMGTPITATNCLLDAKKIDPTNSDIYYHLGLAYFEQNKNAEAKTNLTKAINLDKENSKAHNLLAFVNQKIITEAINKAYSLYQQKDYISSFEILDKEIKEFPENSQLYYYRALIFTDMNRNAAAIIDLQKSTTYDPANYMAFYQLGKVYEKIKNERSALVAYERFLSIEPDEKELVEEVQKKVLSLSAKYY